MKIFATLAVLAFATGAAQAATYTLDFAGDICGTGTGACANGSAIAQGYGDVAGQLDVIYDGNAATGQQPLLHWGTGYETLGHVAYATASGTPFAIVFQAASGFEVAVEGFDIAPYADRVRNSMVTVVAEGMASPLLETGLFEVSTDGVTHFPLGSVFASSVTLVLGPDAWDVGIGNIVYTLRETGGAAAIPLPATGVLLIGGLAALGARRRRTV